MTRQREPDWQPRSDEVQSDLVASYDAMRERCPIAYDGNDSWTVFGHADAVAVADDTATYSNAVSRHLQVPNGSDGAAHRDYRTMIDRYFTDDALAGFEPTLRSIRTQLDARRGRPATDPTGSLLEDRLDGRPLSDEEIVSIIRNWSVAELGTIAASAGVVAGFLARHPDVQEQLRADPGLLDVATDEIQRMNSPFVASRRRVTVATEIAGTPLEAEDRVYVVWTSANRDPRVFGDPDEFRLDRDPADNLVYGRGEHYCPGARLARLELRVLFEELFSGTIVIAPGAQAPVPARYPAGGWSRLPVRLT